MSEPEQAIEIEENKLFAYKNDFENAKKTYAYYQDQKDPDFDDAYVLSSLKIYSEKVSHQEFLITAIKGSSAVRDYCERQEGVPSRTSNAVADILEILDGVKGTSEVDRIETEQTIAESRKNITVNETESSKQNLGTDSNATDITDMSNDSSKEAAEKAFDKAFYTVMTEGWNRKNAELIEQINSSKIGCYHEFWETFTDDDDLRQAIVAALTRLIYLEDFVNTCVGNEIEYQKTLSTTYTAINAAGILDIPCGSANKPAEEAAKKVIGLILIKYGFVSPPEKEGHEK